MGNPWRFQGRRFDPESGLFYFRLRFLDAGRGRFVSRDPIGIWGDGGNKGNGYAFAGGDPLNRVDPLGLDWWDDFKATVGVGTDEWEGASVPEKVVAGAIGALWYATGNGVEATPPQTAPAPASPRPTSPLPGLGGTGEGNSSSFEPLEVEFDNNEYVGELEQVRVSYSIYETLSIAQGVGAFVGLRMFFKTVRELSEQRVIRLRDCEDPEIRLYSAEDLRGARNLDDLSSFNDLAEMSDHHRSVYFQRMIEHSFEEHFAGRQLAGVRTREDLLEKLNDIFYDSQCGGVDIMDLEGGGAAYWDEIDEVLLIFRPNSADFGTVMVPNTGRRYFERLSGTLR